MLEGTILWAVMIAVLVLGFVIGTIVQKAIDDAEISREREKRHQLSAAFERERENATRAYLHGMHLVREERRRHEEERQAFLACAEDLEDAVRREKLRADIYKRGGTR